MPLKIYTDGASRNNPGKSASGYIVLDEDGNLLFGRSFYNGIKTNNEAEYLAIIAALESVLQERGEDTEITLYSDSRLAISQLRGEYKVRSHELRKLHDDAKLLLKRFSSYELVNVPREDVHISEVDASLNLLLDKHEKEI